MVTTIGKLFSIEYGQKEYENKQPLDGEWGSNMLISSKGEDNGVYGFYKINNYYKAPIITVPRVGTIGQAFVQETDCSVDNNCLVLTPLKKMPLEQLYQVALQIRKSKWKYKYGRQITPDRLGEHPILLTDTEKDWEAFELKITPRDNRKPIQSRRRFDVTHIKLKDLFSVVKGQGSYLEKLGEGSTPVISTTTTNNGICGFYDIDPFFKAPCITIGRIMGNPFVQLLDFATVPDDLFVLIPKKDMSKPFLFFVSSIIKNEGWRFNYSRKVTKKKLEEMYIPLPLNDKEVNFDYIQQVSENSYGYNDL